MGYTAGVFDLLHHGHVNYLKACALHCCCLIVGVDVDELVYFKKGPLRPIQSHEIRLAQVLEVSCVQTGFFKKCSAEEILPSLRPDLYFIPENRELGQKRKTLIQKLGIELVRIPYTEDISTSSLIARDR